MQNESFYRGRIAPTPSGWLHAGHAKTFFEAWRRARSKKGSLVLRMEDIDRERCRNEFEGAILEDLEWLGIDWDEGINPGGPYSPYRQSERMGYYRSIWQSLAEDGLIYPCSYSRRELSLMGLDRESDGSWKIPPSKRESAFARGDAMDEEVNWRFKVPEGLKITFEDGVQGVQHFVAGEDFGDFLVWRKTGEPSYELAVVVDDIAMEITEVVRGEDLLLSTARQILLYQALGKEPPSFRHLPLVYDEKGNRLSKSERSLAVREMRASGMTQKEVLEWQPSGQRSHSERS
ncbi:MAG: tRNA glutamyl-Q(34) synthetase GluQRS [Verrucomicrobiota bacterium]